MKGILSHFCFALAYTSFGFAFGVIILYGYSVVRQPAIEAWHTATLDEEFSVGRRVRVHTFHNYLNLEKRLFAQLDEQVVQRQPLSPEQQLNRFSAGSLVDPGSREFNWNRSFEMSARPTIGGVLMLHGLSDSPYSLRNLGRFLSSKGFRVVGLRLPGHGTAPASLMHTTWKDYATAIRIAARHLDRRLENNQPMYILGVSNGAALAVEYTLAVLEGEALPPVTGLILVSPAIRVPPIDPLARWRAKLARFPGLEKFGWTRILPEFDPYRYNSFPLFAAQQVDELQTSLSERIEKLSSLGRMDYFPRTVVFQSAVDATVAPESIVDNLLGDLKPGNHELVLFDINRFATAELLLNPGAGAICGTYLKDPNLPFDLTVVTNRDSDTREVMALRKAAYSQSPQGKPLELRWPLGIFSLSHIALPFPPTDPVYGELRSEDPRRIALGAVELRGEQDVLAIPEQLFQRLRYNPFFDYLQERILAAIAPRKKRPNAPPAAVDQPTKSTR
ncbi:MAG: alpha/beta hydrolase [Gammaproteobacteria bacterium]